MNAKSVSILCIFYFAHYCFLEILQVDGQKQRQPIGRRETVKRRILKKLITCDKMVFKVETDTCSVEEIGKSFPIAGNCSSYLTCAPPVEADTESRIEPRNCKPGLIFNVNSSNCKHSRKHKPCPQLKCRNETRSLSSDPQTTLPDDEHMELNGTVDSAEDDGDEAQLSVPDDPEIQTTIRIETAEKNGSLTSSSSEEEDEDPNYKIHKANSAEANCSSGEFFDAEKTRCVTASEANNNHEAMTDHSNVTQEQEVDPITASTSSATSNNVEQVDVDTFKVLQNTGQKSEQQMNDAFTGSQDSHAGKLSPSAFAISIVTFTLLFHSLFFLVY